MDRYTALQHFSRSSSFKHLLAVFLQRVLTCQWCVCSRCVTWLLRGFCSSCLGYVARRIELEFLICQTYKMRKMTRRWCQQPQSQGEHWVRLLFALACQYNYGPSPGSYQVEARRSSPDHTSFSATRWWISIPLLWKVHRSQWLFTESFPSIFWRWSLLRYWQVKRTKNSQKRPISASKLLNINRITRSVFR